MNATDKELPPVQHLLADLGTMQRPSRMQEEEFEMDTQHIPPVSYRNTMETDEIKPNPLQGPDASQRVSDVTEIPQPLRVYQVWPGKNVFFFRGHLVCGPNPRGFLLTTISILLSNWIFCVYIGDDLPKHSALIITFSVILAIIVLVNLFILCTRDPGIIPRSDHPPIEEDGPSNQFRRKTVVLNGVEIRLKYCQVCKLFRPPRSCHCAVCDNCVEKFDHHCPWIGQCIGLLNYRFYLMFISSALVFFIYILTFSCRRIKEKMSGAGAGLLATLRTVPEALALAWFGLFAICFLAVLVTYNAYLISVNQTAYENFRQRYNNSMNPYDKGVFSNIMEALLAKLPPSKVNFQAVVVPSQICPHAMSQATASGSGFRPSDARLDTNHGKEQEN
ncbi:putative protein S-acyltransferase 7 [Cinnamomum micranthum f. kanehirae]|uniref:S-acyltransferase n=1 Tax=Cinnamomum micranthum f. kanehirae TaxID=337451 RepID=A0A443PCC5_9MAGN|nr:putative protein S-acyltransferase 7 [Cinnamomum micranthum f. kanehirae]